MYIKDLEIGKIYTEFSEGVRSIVLCNGYDNNITCILGEQYLTKARFSSPYKWEPASPEQEKWLRSCIEADKFIPKKQNTKPNYFIY